MKVVLASKYYYRRGGLESYLFNLKELLETDGISVIPFSTNYKKNINSEFAEYFCTYFELSDFKKNHLSDNFMALRNMFYNYEAYHNVKRLLVDQKPDILQGFGITKHLSYSVFKAAKEHDVRTVFRLSDLALMCPNSIALDGKGRICSELDCKTRFNLRILKTRCVQHSMLASSLGYVESLYNSYMAGYKKYVDLWLAPSQFIRDMFVKYYNVPEEKIMWIPPFVDTNNIPAVHAKGDFILFAGRLTEYKGIKTLLRAMELSNTLKLVIAGEGPLSAEIYEYISRKGLRVEMAGFKDKNALFELIAQSISVVVPSECYENFPNIILEAYSLGTPVVASRIGGIPEMVQDDYTGYLFEPGNHEDLAAKLELVLNKYHELGKQARNYVEAQYNKETHKRVIIETYTQLLTC